LLGLDCVRQYLPTNAHSERDYAIALRRYLEDAVQRVDSLQYRTLLEVILGVGDEDWKAKAWRAEKAKTRRREAGRVFRGSDDYRVEADTIRQHHEPKAVRILAEIVLHDEALARGCPHPQRNNSL
jgi:hypothetical protein